MDVEDDETVTLTLDAVTLAGTSVPLVEVDMNNTATFDITDDEPAAMLSAGTSLTEANLNGATVQIMLRNVMFSGSLALANFSTNNVPGLSLSTFVQVGQVVTLTLMYVGDFDTDITDFTVTIAAAGLDISMPLTTNALTIMADADPPTGLSSISAASTMINEGSQLEVTLVLDNSLATGETVMVSYTLSARGTSNRAEPEDFSATDGFMQMVVPGTVDSTTRIMVTFNISTLSDADPDNEDATLTIDELDFSASDDFSPSMNNTLDFTITDSPSP